MAVGTVCFVRTRSSQRLTMRPHRLAEHIGTKTAVQIRSHAQKFFSKLEREQAAGNTSGTRAAPRFVFQSTTSGIWLW